MLAIDLLWLAAGLYMKYIEHPLAEKITGSAVLFLAFVLLPLFLYHRYKDKKAEDYMLNKEKIDRIIDNLKM